MARCPNVKDTPPTLSSVERVAHSLHQASPSCSPAPAPGLVALRHSGRSLA